ncbi:hypothetical protein N9L38_02785 [Candidatus Poseidoniales archaeon]|nr:hypothetical protein [Candidatus Poseidoniales archaeon]
MEDDIVVEVLDGFNQWDLERIYRLKKDVIPRNNMNEPISYWPERIPIKIKSNQVNKFTIQAELHGSGHVEEHSSLSFVVATHDLINDIGGNNIVGQENWCILTQNWKEGSIASITLVSDEADNSLDLNLDLWMFVNGLDETLTLELTVDPLNSVLEPVFKTVKFCKEKAKLVPSHTGVSFNDYVIDRNEQLGAYGGGGNKSSLHPKQIFTSSILRKIVANISKMRGRKLKIAYIGLDTGENFFSVNRTLNDMPDIAELCLIHHPEWDNRFFPKLHPIIDQKLSGTNFKITHVPTNDLEENIGNYTDIDVIVSTFVTSWSGSSVKETLGKLMCNETILLSVEPTKPEYVARSYNSLTPKNIWDIFRSPEFPKLYPVDITSLLDLSSDTIQWNAWSTTHDWSENNLTLASKKIDDESRLRHKYLSSMIVEGSLIKCAGYYLDCTKLYNAEINQPKLIETTVDVGESYENRYSDFPDMSFGIIGEAGVGKSIRFRQLFIERLQLIKEFNFKKIPIFLKAKEFENAVRRFLQKPDDFQHTRVNVSKEGLNFYSVTPEYFEDLPYSVIFEILAESVVNSTPSLKNYFKKQELLKLFVKGNLELFIDGCDEVSKVSLGWIESLCKKNFYDHHTELQSNEDIINSASEMVTTWELLTGIGEPWDSEQVMDSETRKYISENFETADFDWIIDDLTTTDQYLYDAVYEHYLGLHEYIHSALPFNKVVNSFCLSGRPNVRDSISRIVGSNQMRLFESPYMFTVVEISPINFTKNIHYEIFEGIAGALSLNHKPVRKLLDDIVTQNPDAWDHPFRIGWLVYFLCEGKTKEELGIELSTSSFEKLLIEQITNDSIVDNETMNQINSERKYEVAYGIITAIAAISHPAIKEIHSENLVSISEYLKDTHPKWQQFLMCDVDFEEFKDFFTNQIPLYSHKKDTTWSHQRLHDSATALHLEDSSNLFSVFNSVLPPPGIFNDLLLLISPQLTIDRISLRVDSKERLELLRYVFAHIDGELTINIGRMWFLNQLLDTYSSELTKVKVELESFSRNIVENIDILYPRSFGSAEQCLHFSDLGGVYSYFGEELKIKVDATLVQRLRASKVDGRMFKDISENINFNAKRLIHRLSNFKLDLSEPVPMIGEIALLGCDLGLTEHKDWILPHLESYLLECGHGVLAKIKSYLEWYDHQFKPMVEDLVKRDNAVVKLTPALSRLMLLIGVSKKIFDNVVVPSLSDARPLYPLNNKFEGIKITSNFTGLQNRNRINSRQIESRNNSDKWITDESNAFWDNEFEEED